MAVAGLRVYMLGTGGAGAPPGRAENCYLVESASTRLLLDAGPGCAQRLLEHGFEPYSVDAVYISHRHVDHLAGLFDISVHASAAGRPLPPVLAAEGALGEIESQVRLHVIGSAAQSLRLVPLPSRGPSHLGDLALALVPGRHPAISHGLLVEHGGVAVYYSADTSLTPSVAEAVSRADLSLVEASLPPGSGGAAEKLGHMTVEQAASLAARARPGAIVALVHVTAGSAAHVSRAEPPSGAAARLLAPSDGTVVRLA